MLKLFQALFKEPYEALQILTSSNFSSTCKIFFLTSKAVFDLWSAKKAP